MVIIGKENGLFLNIGILKVIFFIVIATVHTVEVTLIDVVLCSVVRMSFLKKSCTKARFFNSEHYLCLEYYKLQPPVPKNFVSILQLNLEYMSNVLAQNDCLAGMRCDQNLQRVFLLHMNRSLHGNVHAKYSGVNIHTSSYLLHCSVIVST